MFFDICGARAKVESAIEHKPLLGDPHIQLRTSQNNLLPADVYRKTGRLCGSLSNASEEGIPGTIENDLSKDIRAGRVV